jgi:chromosome segregation ATPase
MDEQLMDVGTIASVITAVTVMVGMVLAVLKFGPERRVLAVEASRTATITMDLALKELRAELAVQKMDTANAQRESINKDIQHGADIKAQREQIEALQTEAEAERERHEKREKELTVRVEKLEKELAETQASYAKLEEQYKKVVAENKLLRDRVRALEGKQDEKKIEPEAETKGDAKA